MIALIAALAKNRTIGKNGCIPWEIEGEKRRFRELTTGNVVVMGRRTYEEIGQPLPDRTTIVVSSKKKFESENCFSVGSLREALQLAGERKVFISGGAALYKEALPMADVLYLTEIDAVVEGDTFFPVFDEKLFEKEENEYHPGKMPYMYVTYRRKRDV